MEPPFIPRSIRAEDRNPLDKLMCDQGIPADQSQLIAALILAVRLYSLVARTIHTDFVNMDIFKRKSGQFEQILLNHREKFLTSDVARLHFLVGQLSVIVGILITQPFAVPRAQSDQVIP